IANQSRLVFTGHVDDEQLAALYKGAYAFVSASLHEGFGLPGVEAMRFGLPLAVSNSEVFNEVYDNASIYFNALDADNTAAKMYLLAHDAPLCAQLQGHSLKRGQMFSWQTAAKQTLEVYQKAYEQSSH